MNALAFQTPEELQTILGVSVRRLRLSRNLDQRMTAEKAGISESDERKRQIPRHRS